MADYLAYDGLHVTYDALVYYLTLIEDGLYAAEKKAYEAGQEDWSDAFAEARDMVMDIMPMLPARNAVDDAKGVRS
jgi:Mg2+ and Co2+ transporter CorA